MHIRPEEKNKDLYEDENNVHTSQKHFTYDKRCFYPVKDAFEIQRVEIPSIYTMKWKCYSKDHLAMFRG